ncbi:MAG: family 1 encapsulin nanocompartment shell protein, partial [Actinomycetes bacterium]
ELANASRGNHAIDLGPLEEAAKAIALAENTAVFHGYPGAGIRGITEASSHDHVQASGEWGEFPQAVAVAVERLLLAGIGGPYGLALGDDAWVGVVEATERGSTLIGHLSTIVNGPIVWAPGAHGGIVVSQRGGDFTIDSGQDLSIGYSHHDADTVTLYLEESFTFRVEEPDAAVALVVPATGTA